MKSLDLLSTFVAAIVGALTLALLVWVYDQLSTDDPLASAGGSILWAVFGALVGVTVQISERVTGAS